MVPKYHPIGLAGCIIKYKKYLFDVLNLVLRLLFDSRLIYLHIVIQIDLHTNGCQIIVKIYQELMVVLFIYISRNLNH